MKKKIAIYYAVLSLILCFQLLSTVFTLSQNIGYGQRISLLENKKTSLESQKNQLSKELSKKIALQALDVNTSEYVGISEVVSVQRTTASLALN